MSEVTAKLVVYKSTTGNINTFVKEAYIKYLEEFDELEEDSKIISLEDFTNTFDLKSYIESISDDEYYIIEKEDWITVVFYSTLSTLYEGNTSNVYFETLNKYNKESYSFIHSMYYNGGGGVLDEILKQM